MVLEQLVTLKSYQKGLTLSIREDGSREEILEEVIQKFKQAKSFFGEMQVAISFEGKQLTDEEIGMIIEKIHMYSNLQVVCVVGKDEKLQLLYDKGIQSFEREKIEILSHENIKMNRKCDARIIYQSLSGMEEITSSETVIVYGNVEQGAVIHSQKDIIILGALLGEADAGQDGKEEHFVMALEMQPQRLSIGEKKYNKKTSGISFFRGNSKKQPVIAYKEKDQIVMKAVSKEVMEMRISIEEI